MEIGGEGLLGKNVMGYVFFIGNIGKGSKKMSIFAN